ncbi:MAG: DUF169 domain-containing protein [Dehalococcoidia bacterium]|nr:DUF169 domain-containing protein [Dehalococcoidia bacterium]
MNSILEKNIKRARQMERHLRLTTMPVGIRLWKNRESIPDGAGERPSKKHSFCQYLTMARTYAADVQPTFLLKADDFSCLIGPGMLGITEKLESILSGEHVEQIHFESKELAKSTMDTLPSVPPHTMQGVTVAALEHLTVEPDIVFAAVYPGMVNRIMDASLWYTGGPYTTSYGSLAGICSSAAAKAYVDESRVSVVAFPCMGSRRWGGMTDMDLALAVNIKQFDRFIKGLENTWLTGHSYPVAVHLGEVYETHHPIPAESYSSVYPYCYEH